MNASLLLEILGKSPGSLVMQQFLAEIGEHPEIENYGNASVHCFRRSGVELRYRSNGASVDSVLLNMSESDRFVAYGGDLPGGIRFTDARNDVRRKLGSPARSGTRRPNLAPPPSMSHEVWKGFLSPSEQRSEATEWDLYISGRFAFHFEFDGARQGKISRVTLTLHRAA